MNIVRSLQQHGMALLIMAATAHGQAHAVTFAPAGGVPNSSSTAILLVAAIASMTLASRSRGKPPVKRR
jgi:hypothetical protein